MFLLFLFCSFGNFTCISRKSRNNESITSGRLLKLNDFVLFDQFTAHIFVSFSQKNIFSDHIFFRICEWKAKQTPRKTASATSGWIQSLKFRSSSFAPICYPFKNELAYLLDHTLLNSIIYVSLAFFNDSCCVIIESHFQCNRIRIEAIQFTNRYNRN